MRHVRVTAAEECPPSGKQSSAGPRKPVVDYKHPSTHQEIFTPQKKNPWPSATLTRQTALEGQRQRRSAEGWTRRPHEMNQTRSGRRVGTSCRGGNPPQNHKRQRAQTKPPDERRLTRAAAVTLQTKHDAAQRSDLPGEALRCHTTRPAAPSVPPTAVTAATLTPESWLRSHTGAAHMHTGREVRGRRGMRGDPEEQEDEETRSSHAPRKCYGC